MIKKQPKKITCSLSKKHILSGKAGSYDRCPAVLAIKEATGNNNVRVDWDLAYIDEQPYKLPANIRIFISLLDGGPTCFKGTIKEWFDSLKPMEFTITIIE
jgi:hypothetical protein